PMSLLNQMRRQLVAKLDQAASANHERSIARGPVLPELCAPIARERERQIHFAQSSAASVELSVLCRQTDQIEAAAALGVATIYAEYQDIKRYGEAVAAARRGCGHCAIWLATPRIEKPGEAAIFSHLAKHGADGLLVRNAGGVRFCV